VTVRQSPDPPRPPVGAETMSSAMLEIPQYYRWMTAQFADALGDTVLDVGTGPGVHLPFLGARRLIAADLSADCLAELRRRFPALETVQGDVCDPAFAAAMAGKRVDTITCLNVLEHIEDHAAALAAFRAILAPRGGRLVLVVPAHQALYGAMDRLAGHVRRYSRSALVRLLLDAGFTGVRVRHFNCVGGVGWYLNAKLLRARDLSAPAVNGQIRVFGTLVLPIARVVDAVACRALHLPFGQSLVAVAGATRGHAG
jgi:SAM-dependent methyltransferase